MRFNNADDLRAYLISLEGIYEPYAAGMWMLGIRSTEMIVNSTKADMANVLAHPDPPGPSHQIHASDMIARSRPAGMLMRLHGGPGCTPFTPCWQKHDCRGALLPCVTQ